MMMAMWDTIREDFGVAGFIGCLVITGLVPWFLDFHARKKLQDKIGKNSEKLQEFTSKLEKGTLIFRAQFEKEFSNYINLSDGMNDVLHRFREKIEIETTRLGTILYRAEDEIYDILPKDLPCKFIDGENEKILSSFELMLNQKRPFINENVYERFKNLAFLLRKICNNPPGCFLEEKCYPHSKWIDKETFEDMAKYSDYKIHIKDRCDELFRAGKEIDDAENELISDIRMRIDKLKIVD